MDGYYYCVRKKHRGRNGGDENRGQNVGNSDRGRNVGDEGRLSRGRDGRETLFWGGGQTC